jgi:hypothetical protein
MGRPHLAHHVELQFHVCRQLLEYPLRVVLIHEQVREKTGQCLPVAVSGIAEVAEHHHHCKDDLAFGGFLLWSHGKYLAAALPSMLHDDASQSGRNRCLIHALNSALVNPSGNCPAISSPASTMRFCSSVMSAYSTVGQPNIGAIQ